MTKLKTKILKCPNCKRTAQKPTYIKMVMCGCGYTMTEIKNAVVGFNIEIKPVLNEDCFKNKVFDFQINNKEIRKNDK